MARRSTSLNNFTDTSISRDIGSKYDNVVIVADNIDKVSTVAGISEQVEAVSDNKVSVVNVANNLEVLNSLYNDKFKLDRVYQSTDEIDRIFTSADNIDTIADDISNIDIVASDTIAINEIYNNRVEIYQADENAAIAAAKAAEALVSEGLTEGYRDETATMKLAVESIYDAFDDRFIGAKASEPMVDNDGNALTEGALFFNSTTNELNVYSADNTEWIAIPGMTLAALKDTNLGTLIENDMLAWRSGEWVNTDAVIASSVQLSGGTGDDGKLTWDPDENTLDLVAGNTTLQIGQETYINVKNQSGSVITNGAVVMAAGTLGASGRILITPYDGVSLPKYILGITTESIADGEDGKVTSFGKIRGIDTSAWSEGDELFVTTNGGLTNVEPTSGINIAIAYVINVHAVNGTIMVRFTPYDENLSYTKDESDTNLEAHTSLTDNPHSVTKEQVGLGNANNTADNIKNVLSATKWTTAMTLTLDGDVSGSVSIDGSINKSITVTIADDSHNHIIANVDGLQATLDAIGTETEFEGSLV